jgi:hypothetical protein
MSDEKQLPAPSAEDAHEDKSDERHVECKLFLAHIRAWKREPHEVKCPVIDGVVDVSAMTIHNAVAVLLHFKAHNPNHRAVRVLNDTLFGILRALLPENFPSEHYTADEKLGVVNYLVEVVVAQRRAEPQPERALEPGRHR